MLHLYAVLHRLRRATAVVLCVLCAALAIPALPSAASAEDRDPAYAEFYETLDQHGEWIVHPRFGQIWVPHANDDRDWRPYSRGQWAYTDEHGWYWESDEEWGWITYHYGRWLLDDRHGWMWVPGSEWGPAWVAWREGEDSIGWAPLPPEAEFDFAEGSVATFDVYDTPQFAPLWVFVRPAMLTMPGVWRYCHPPRQNALYFGRTRFVTHYSYRDRRIYNRGIDRRVIEGHTRRPVPVLQVRPVGGPRELRAGRLERERRTVGVYRPEIAARSGRDEGFRAPFGPGSGGRPGSAAGATPAEPFGRRPGRPDNDRFDQPRPFGREPGLGRGAPPPDSGPRRAERSEGGRFEQPRPPFAPGYGRGPGPDGAPAPDSFGRRQGPPSGGFGQPRRIEPPQAPNAPPSSRFARPPSPPVAPPVPPSGGFARPPAGPPPAGLGARPPMPPMAAPSPPRPQVRVPPPAPPRPQVQAPPPRPQVQAPPPAARRQAAPPAAPAPGANTAGRPPR